MGRMPLIYFSKVSNYDVISKRNKIGEHDNKKCANMLQKKY